MKIRKGIQDFLGEKFAQSILKQSKIKTVAIDTRGLLTEKAIKTFTKSDKLTKAEALRIDTALEKRLLSPKFIDVELAKSLEGVRLRPPKIVKKPVFDIKKILEVDGYPTKITAGKNYHTMERYEI